MEGYEDLVPKQKTVGDVMSDSYADLVPEKKPSIFEPIKEKIPSLIVPPQIKAFTSVPEKYRTAIGKGAMGETKKLVGGALDLLPGETGKKLYESGERQVKEAEEISPTATIVGQTGPYLGTYAGIGRGLKALKVPSPTTKLGRVAETAGTAATTGAITTPGGVEERAKEAAAQGALGGILQTGFEVVPGIIRGARKLIKGEPVGSPTGYVELGERIKSEIPKIKSKFSGYSLNFSVYFFCKSSLRPSCIIIGVNLI
jgi:hypothetical protein